MSYYKEDEHLLHESGLYNVALEVAPALFYTRNVYISNKWDEKMFQIGGYFYRIEDFIKDMENDR
jgi:hypothetical protein